VVLHTVTGHAGLARNTGRDEDDLGALEGIAKAGGGRVEASDSAVGVDVAEISSDTWGSEQSVRGGFDCSATTVARCDHIPGPPRIS
jgi:hypothetical protein